MILICNYIKYVWLHFLEMIGRHQFKIRDPRILVTYSVCRRDNVTFWWTRFVDPLLRSRIVDNVCDHNRIVIKYDHE